MSATNDVKIFAAMIALGGFLIFFKSDIWVFGDIFNKKNSFIL
ncbi:hypothetical protein NQU59_14355 [Acinetobacter colistiniresistens]|nr:hypothetical protein [Acinetobacter colistiniresistens]UUM26851.1 hypothetical protein NQU59_14355 [Acinetobacter colistiniresistens]